MKKLIFGFSLAAIIVAIMVDRVGSAALFGELRNVAWPTLAAALVLQVGQMSIKAWRWGLAVRTATHRPVTHAFTASMIGFAGNMVLPGRLGELLRVDVFAKRNGVARSLAITALAITQLLDLFTVCVYGLVISLWMSGRLPISRSIILGGLGFCLVSFAFLCVLKRGESQPGMFLNFVKRIVPVRLQGGIDFFSEQFKLGLGLLADRRALLSAAGLTLLAWSVETASYALALHAFHIPVSPLVVGLTVVVLNLAFAIPLTPGNVGPHQLLSVLTLGLFAVPEAQALSFSVGFQGLGMLVVLSLGAWSFYRHRTDARRQRSNENAAGENASGETLFPMTEVSCAESPVS